MRRPRLSVLTRRGDDEDTPLLSLPYNYYAGLDRKSRRKFIRWSLITGNFILLLSISVFIAVNRSASQTIRTSTANSATVAASSLPNPLDQLSSAQIALQAAQMTNLPELTMVRNRADSEAALLNIVPNSDTTLAKPQIVQTAQKSRFDIVRYTVKDGDTISELAARYHVSANSIRWSNDVFGEVLQVGSHILVPPGNGVVYKVQAGDTIDSVVDKFQANKDSFIAVNDAESGHLPVGELVWIPNGVQPVQAAVFTFAPVQASFSAISGGFYYTGPCIPNGYDCGWCTWWTAYRRAQIGRPVPPNLGDAYTWGIIGPSEGLGKGNRPQAGAVIWMPSINHVGFVESVKPDGSVYISDMNFSGWNIVTYRTIPASEAGNYSYLY